MRHSQAERMRLAAQKALAAVGPVRRSAVAKRAEEILPLYRPGYLKAAAGMASPRAAIKAHCQMCMGWEDVVSGIRNCTGCACPLFAYRPFQEGK